MTFRTAGPSGRSAALAALATAVVTVAGCSAALWEGAAAGLAAATSSSSAAGPRKLMLFGGEGHKTYLGCLTCSEYDPESIFNEYGNYGSSYSQTSVLNNYSPYGSRYAPHGACNPYASDPPAIVDSEGNFYGRLTMNQYHQQRTSNGDLLAWLAAVCSQ